MKCFTNKIILQGTSPTIFFSWILLINCFCLLSYFTTAITVESTFYDSNLTKVHINWIEILWPERWKTRNSCKFRAGIFTSCIGHTSKVFLLSKVTPNWFSECELQVIDSLETRQKRKYQSRQNISLDPRNRFAPFQNTQDEVLDIEAKNYKEKETLQHRHHTPAYGTQNHRPNPVINHFSENGNTFWQQRTIPESSKYSDTVQNGKKTFIVGTSMVKGIKMKEVNFQLRNSFAKLEPFPGVTLKNLRYYFVPSLINETPNRIILHGVESVIMSMTKIQLQKRLQMK